ncbi:hypothetical protein [Kineosporia sp. A_224]|uniref:hypothetical protein n=1 Tax=Kineosporia sp. A_224 TaxID=1962180 RepID=UPI001304706D|nr:hypothetical protein [Kineosporia sp. A_224]
MKVDGGRIEGANPRIFTAVVSGPDDYAARFDDTDLARCATKAISAFDARLES